MPSTKADIISGATFRPRLNGTYCKLLRKSDTCIIISYYDPVVLIEYKSDHVQLSILDTVLLDEYKLTLKAPVLAKTLSPVIAAFPVPQPASATPYAPRTEIVKQPNPVVLTTVVPDNACKHTNTFWCVDEEICRDCPATVKVLSGPNPYNVDPDTKRIPAYVAERINRNGNLPYV